MIDDPDRDERAEMPTRHPCPLGSDFDPKHSCFLCSGCGISTATYVRWVAAGRPPTKPEGWES